MSNKSDTDNRANQLNPNNDAYYSSRGNSGGCVDDEDDGIREPHYCRPLGNPFKPEAHGIEFRAGFVGFSGKTQVLRFFVFKTIATGMFGASANAQLDIEDFAERVLTELSGSLKTLWQEDLALVALFNQRGRELEWMTTQYDPKGPLGRSAVKDHAWHAGAQQECEAVRRKLAGQKVELDEAGCFEVRGSKLLTAEDRNLISGFVRAQRLGHTG